MTDLNQISCGLLITRYYLILPLINSYVSTANIVFGLYCKPRKFKFILLVSHKNFNYI